MNAVDRFSSTLARYRQVPQAQQMGVQSAQQAQAVYLPPQLPTAPVQPQPAPRNDLDRALSKVNEVTPVLSRLAALVHRVQQPAPAPAAAYPATPGIVPGAAPAVGPMGQSLQRLSQAVGNRDVDQFVRQTAPVIDEAIPLIEDVVNLINGKPVRPVAQPAGAPAYPVYGAQAGSPTFSQTVTPVVDGVTSLVSGVSSLVNAIGGLFK